MFNIATISKAFYAFTTEMLTRILHRKLNRKSAASSSTQTCTQPNCDGRNKFKKRSQLAKSKKFGAICYKNAKSNKSVLIELRIGFQQMFGLCVHLQRVHGFFSRIVILIFFFDLHSDFMKVALFTLRLKEIYTKKAILVSKNSVPTV